MTDPADLSVLDAAGLLRRRKLSSSELVSACLRRIENIDGVHTSDGDLRSINAWVRLYPDDALRDAAWADDRLSARAQRELGPPPLLCGIPIGLKDLYAVAGKPLTASSSLLRAMPDADCDVWARLRAAGMVLLGHTHTHEFAAGGTTDQVGNPWALERSAGGSSGGSAAALAGRMVPAATGTDTAGSLRIPSALCATSTIKPTRNLVPTSGVVPLAPTLDHCGPMARSVADCALLLAAMAGPDLGEATTAFAALPDRRLPEAPAGRPLVGVRLALSMRARARDGCDDDVRGGLRRAVETLRELGATVVEPASAPAAEPNHDQLAVLCTEMLAFHRRFAGARDGYRTSTREFLEYGERIAVTGEGYVRIQQQRRDVTRRWWQWLDDENVAAIVEPTVPVVAPPRGTGYDAMGNDAALVSLTYLWNWTGFPVVSLPAGLGRITGLPVGVSLIGRPGSDAALLAIGEELQQALGIPELPAPSG